MIAVTSAPLLAIHLLAAVKLSQMEVSTKDLKNIEVELNKNGGFTVWVTEIKRIAGKNKKCRHWIIDGSCIMEDGEVRIGNSTRTWKVEAKYDKSSRSLKVVRG